MEIEVIRSKSRTCCQKHLPVMVHVFARNVIDVTYKSDLPSTGADRWYVAHVRSLRIGDLSERARNSVIKLHFLAIIGIVPRQICQRTKCNYCGVVVERQRTRRRKT